MTPDTRADARRTDGATSARSITGGHTATQATGVRAAGLVLWIGPQPRPTAVVVKAIPAQGEVRFVRANADGEFAFENLTPGLWSFAALYEQGKPVVLPQQPIRQDRDDLKLVLNRLGGTVDDLLGQ